MAVATDVTEQVVSRMQVEKSHKELQFVMDVMPQLVWHTLPDGSADYFNQVFLNYSGLSLDQLGGMRWTSLVHPDDLERTVTLWQDAVAGRKPYVLEHRLKGADNAYRWFLTRGVPLKDESGNNLKWYGTTTDIDMQKSNAEILEQRVQERTMELEMRNKEMEQFTYAASHDMQEPLRKVSTFANILLDEHGSHLNAHAQRYLTKIDTSVKRMKCIIDDLLHYSHHARSDQGFASTDLNLLFDEIKADLDSVIEKKGAAIISEELPTIAGVPNQLRQLFYNLMANALKFSKNGIAPTIEIHASPVTETSRLDFSLNPNRKYVLINITDNGIGFDQRYAQQIFTIFQRLHLKSEYEGTGIGLALCKKIVDNHKGHIWAESSVGNGSTFKVCLPAAVDVPPLSTA
jgi:PAS domain S-box-containing protein